MTAAGTTPADTLRAIHVFWRAILLRRGVLASAVIATVAVNVISLATSLYSMQVYDRVIPRGGFSTLWVLTVGVLAALLFDFALRATRALMLEREAARIDAEVSGVFFSHAAASRLDARPSGVGTLAAQIRGLEQVRGLLSSGFVFLIADLPFALFFIVVIASLGGVVAIAPLMAFPLTLTLALVIVRAVRADTLKAQVSGNRKNGLLVETFDAAETLKASDGSAHMLVRWNALNDELERHELPVRRWSSIATALFAAAQQVTYVVVVAWGAVLVAEGRMTMGALIACTILTGRVTGPLVSQMPGFLVQWGYARSSLQALDAILALPIDGAPDAGSLSPLRITPSIRAEGVEFAYEGSRSGVRIGALEVSPGERVAVIGGIGSGKSTLLRLLAGLYAPARGTVTVGGLDIAQIAPDRLRRCVGYLPQDTRLLNGTLRENLTLGLDDPGDDAIVAVIEELGLAELIAGHPRGLGLPIAEGGRGLSGGQRTLANLARLFLARPDILLLDEPTANLDQVAEARVLAALGRRLDAGATLILVTHRPQLLSLTRRIVLLHKGEVAEDGASEAVLARLRAAAPPKAAVSVVGAG